MAIDTLGANALASDSVTTAKIVNDAVTAAKIPAGAVVADIADGGITTAKLAADAVTSAKIADDAITQALIAAGAIGNTEVASGISAAKLTTGTLPNAQMPSGSMLQVVQTTATNVHNYGGSSGWSNPSNYNVTITPSSASNKVMVFYNIWGICYNNAKHLTWDLMRTVGGVNSNRFGNVTYGLGAYYTHTMGEFQGPCIAQFLDSPNTTSAVIYKPMFNNVNSASSFNIGDNHRRSVCIAMEIKG